MSELLVVTRPSKANMKYFDFWRKKLVFKLTRAELHRRAVEVKRDAAVMAASAATGQDKLQLRVDLEQLDVALAYYKTVLEPNHAQKTCFSLILTYMAGMMCFCCKPNWLQYVALSGVETQASEASTITSDFALETVIRIRMLTTVCDELWDTCRDYGEQTVLLAAALRDSRIAATAALSQESLDMFSSKEDLCFWLHENIALHPFRLLEGESGSLPTAPPNATSVDMGANVVNTAAVDHSATPARTPSRRLALPKLELDVLWEGRSSTFDQVWKGFSFFDSSGAPCPQCIFSVGLLIAAAMALSTLASS